MSEPIRLLRRLTLLLSVLTVATGVVVGSAVSADRQELAFGVSFFFPGPSVIDPTITELNDNVVRAEDVRYFGVGSTESPGDEAGARLTWIVNRAQMRGNVSGTVSLARSLTGLLWQGELHGRVTPQGAEGVLHLIAHATGQHFSGRWVSDRFVDPASSEHSFRIEVTGTLTSD